MLQIRVGLVDTTGTVDTEMMAAVAAALNVQVTRDLPQFWNINASVCYLPNPHRIPQGVWPVQLVPSLPPGEGGFHLTRRHNQPYAKVVLTPGSEEWTLDASHETLEMLVDPSGNRLQVSTAIEIVGGAIRDTIGEFEYLVEACDPCEADRCAYQIDGITVSDFLTPHFYDAGTARNGRYSFTGAIDKPRGILPGGYISFINPEQNELQQILWLDPREPPVLRNLGPAEGASIRYFVECQTRHLVQQKRAPAGEGIAARKTQRTWSDTVARIRAEHYI